MEALIPRNDVGSCPRLGSVLMGLDGVCFGWCLGRFGRSGSAWGCFRRVGEEAGDQPRDPARLGSGRARIDACEGPGTTRCGGPAPPGAGEGGQGAWGRGRDPLGCFGFSPVVECERPSR